MLSYHLIGRLTFLRYRRSFEHLEVTPKPTTGFLGGFSRRMKHSRDNVGIWHKTYLVRAGDFKRPTVGCARLVEARGSRESARGRLRRTVATSA